MSEYGPDQRQERLRARRRRAAITLAVVVLVLLGAFWYAYSYVRGASGASSTPSPTCTTAAPSTATVTVNVYNGTTRSGLAASTAEQVKKRGFTVAKVANDPLKKSPKGTAEIRFGKSGAKQADQIAALVAGSTKVQDSRKDATVDLVLGAKFTSLAPAPGASGKAALPTCPTP